MTYTNFIAQLPKDYCLIPGNGAIKLVKTKIYIHNFIAQLPKDYCLIPGNGAIKLVGFLLYGPKKSLRVNHFQFWFWLDILQVHRSTSNKMDISPNIDPTEILRILDQLP